MGAGLVLETVDLLLEGKTDAVPQEEFYKDPSELRPAPKIFKETCRIDWLQPVKRVYDFIRGLSPYPAAWTEIVSPKGVRTALKIYQAEKRPAAHELPVGTIRTDRKAISISRWKTAICACCRFSWQVRNVCLLRTS